MHLARPRQPSQIEAGARERGHGLGADERLRLAPHRRARAVPCRRRMRESQLRERREGEIEWRRSGRGETGAWGGPGGKVLSGRVKHQTKKNGRLAIWKGG